MWSIAPRIVFHFQYKCVATKLRYAKHVRAIAIHINIANVHQRKLRNV